MRRRLIYLGVAFLLVAAAMVGLDAAASRMLSGDDLRGRVQALAARLDIDITFEDARLHILPRPRLTFVTVRIGGGPVTGSIDSVSVFPRVRAMLSGKLEAGLLALNTPDLRIDVTPLDTSAGTPAAAPDTRATVAARVSDLARRLQASAPGLALRMDRGTVRFVSAGRTALLLASTDARLAVADDELQLQLRCSSDLWEDLGLQAALRLPDFTGTGSFDVVQLRGLPLAQALDPDVAAALGLTVVSVNGAFSIPDPHTLTLQATGSAPTVTIRRGDTQVALRVAQFAAGVALHPERIEIKLDGIDLESPKLHLSGALSVDRKLPQVRLTLDANDADLAALRATATTLVPDSDVVRQVADIVRAGHLDTLRFSAVGGSAAELGQPGNFGLHGRVSKARLVVPPTSFRLTDVAGDFAIAGGVLRADRASGRTGNTSVSDGHLRIPLLGGIADFALSCRVAADAADVPDILYHFVFDETFRSHLRNIADVSGSIAAELSVRRTWLGWTTRVDTTAFDVRATNRNLGLPLHLRGGRFSYDPARIAAVGVSGRIGQSELTRASGRWGFGEVADVAVLSGPAAVELADASRIAHHYHAGFAARLGIRDASGPVSFDVLRLHVPITPSDSWRLATQGVTPGATFTTDSPLQAVTIATRFAGTRDVLGLSDTAITFADARLTGAGCIMDRGTGLPRFDLQLVGSFGPAATAALATAAGLPPEVGSRREVTAPNLMLVWQPGTFANVQSPFDIANGPFLDLDMQWSPQRVDVRRLLVRDRHSEAILALQMASNQLDVQFRGRLDHETVDNLIARNQYVWGSIEGDFAARVLTTQPDAAQARGTLTARSVVIPMHAGPAAFIESVTLRSEPTRVVVDSGTLTWGDNRLSVNGRADLSAGNIGLDLNVSAPLLDLDPLLATAGPAADVRHSEFRGLPSIPLRGVVRVNADRVSLRDLTWDGVDARVRLTDSGPEALVTGGTFCHLDTPGTIKVTPAGLAVALLPRANEQPLGATLACINAGRTAATGSYTLQADLTGTAPAQQLLGSLSGPINFSATDGRINHMGWLGRVMQVLQPTSVFRGKLPDLDDEGLDYSQASFSGTLHNGTFEIAEAVLRAEPLTLVASGSVNFVTSTMDLAVLASPIGRVNSVLGSIPVLGDILGGAAVSIPVSVSGSLEDPTVIPMNPTAVGEQLFGILKRTVQTPVRLIQPLFPAGAVK